MFLSGINEWITSISTAARNAVDWVGDAARNKINEWRATLGKFKTQYAQLQKTPIPASTTARAQRADLLARAKEISDRAGWVEDQLTKVSGYLGLSGYQPMGILPVLAIPAVLITAMITVGALIYKWSSQVENYFKEQRYVAAATAEGKSPSQATAEAQARNQSSGLFGDLSSALWPIIIGVVGLSYFSKRK